MTEYQFNTMDEFHLELALMKLALFDRAELMADEALEALEDQVRLMGLRDDYGWLRDKVILRFPTGLHNDLEELEVWVFAIKHGMGHIVDALIDELSLKGAGIELALLDQSLA